MSVSQLVGSAGRAESPGNDAILKGSQEAPLEKHLREARQGPEVEMGLSAASLWDPKWLSGRSASGMGVGKG